MSAILQALIVAGVPLALWVGTVSFLVEAVLK